MAWLRRLAGFVAVAVLVVLALVTVVTGQLMPLAERNPRQVADWLSAQAGRTVAFDRLETQWTRRGPLLRLGGLRIGDGDAVFPVGEAELLVAHYSGLLPGRSLTELRIRGLQLDLRRDDDGRWRVHGLPGDSGGDDPIGALDGLGELQVVDAKLAVVAPAIGVEATLPRVAVRMRVQGDRVRAAVRAWTRADTRPSDAVLEFDRRSGDGRAWLSAPRIRLEDWRRLRVAGVSPAAGHGRVEAWATLRDHRVAEVLAELALAEVAVASAPGTAQAVAAAPAPASASTSTSGRMLPLGAIEGRAHWRAVDGGWRLDAPRLRIGGGAQAQVLDGLTVAGGREIALRAGRIDAGPLLALASLSDRVPDGLRRWLRRASPRAEFASIDLSARRDGPLRFDARLAGLRFDAAGNTPGISGAAGTLRGDADGVVFAFDPQARLRFDWPAGFGVVHEVALRGTVSAWRDGRGWQLGTGGLRIEGDGYGADVRGGLAFHGDGSTPSIALAAELDDARVQVAKRFWVHHAMPPESIAWLDAALQGGWVREGRAVVMGDLADWPFLPGAGGTAAPGLFHGSARLDGAVVRFHPDWPAAEALTGPVDFVGNGFRVEGSARIAGVPVSALEAGIDDFGDAPLWVRARSNAESATLLALLRASPLRVGQEATFDALSAKGPVAASFALDLALDGSGRRGIDGRVVLDGVALADSRWKLAFDQVRGEVHYDEHGFAATRLAGHSGGQPATLSLRAGDGHVADPGSAFEAAMWLRLSPAELLAQAPELAWLRPRLSGASAWDVALSVPKQAGAVATAAPAGSLALRSDLVGTRLRLPAPLDKPAGRALPARIDLALPIGDGEVAVALGQVLALRARTTGGATGVRVVLGGGPVEAPPASGLVATGRAARLEPLGWATVLAGGDDAAVPPPPNPTLQALASVADAPTTQPLRLQRIDLRAGSMSLLGAGFADVQVQAAREGAATVFRVDGAAIAGRVAVPDADAAAIDARLQRLHWRRPAPADGDADAIVLRAGAPPPADDDTIDPARIPPLQVAVDDLRIGDARLGAAQFGSRRSPEGMRIERLQARGDDHAISATGAWTGTGTDARTQFSLRVDSDDFGRLFAGFGLAGRLAGGNGEIAFDAGWAGTPMTFSPALLRGRMQITLKDGQLVDVEPGAGRVLGLLSIAQLPRRLLLDFRDFFAKGFGFNRIHGSIAFADGKARSDDLEIDGPAARIRIRGAADLHARSYDQTVEVEPRTGNLLTAVGAITAGPVGAAVGAVANAVLSRPIGEAGMRVYRVTGPWSEPKVEVIDRAAAPAPAPADGDVQ